MNIIFLGPDFYPKDFNDSKEGFYPKALDKVKELYDVKTTLDVTYSRQGAAVTLI